MARGRDDGQSAFDGSGVGARPRFLPSRRAVLFGVPALSISAALAAYVVESRSIGDADDGFDGPVGAGPGTVRVAGKLAGPRAEPVWSADLASDGSVAAAVAYAADTLIVMDSGGRLVGFDPRTGKKTWTSSVLGAPNWNSPLLTVGDVLYIADADGDFVAVGAADGQLRWQVRLPQAEAEVSAVNGVAGSMVFCAGDAGQDSGPDGQLLWGVDTEERRVAWTTRNVGANLTIAGSTSADMVVACDEIEQRVTAYSAQDGQQLWQAAAGNAGEVSVPESAPTCINVVGDTVYWTADRMRALDVKTGQPIWLRAAWEGDEELLGSVVQPAPEVGDLLLAMTVTTDTGGYLYAYLAETGDMLWRQAAGVEFSSTTTLAAASGAVFVAERTNGSVYAVDVATGRTRWTFHDPAATKNLGWPIIANGTRVFVAYGQTVHAFAT